MLSKLVLILDKRKELSTKYKKIIENDGVSVIVASDLETGLGFFNEYEPDLIVVSDSLESSLSEACKKMRVLSYSFRPCIIALSKSSDLKDKLDVLDSGADDFLSEPIDSEEFRARINAHLRRHFENMLDDVTKLPDAKFSLKVLKRTIIEDKAWAGMVVRINEFDSYKEIYGELASDKLLQTFTAIVNSFCEKDDFVGELSSGEFLVLTNPYKVEKLASFLVYAFDNIVEKFYSEDDAKCGYIILHGDDNAGKRVNLVSTSIGVISSDYRKYDTVNAVLNSLFATCKLASLHPNSYYVVERAMLSADNAVFNKEYNNKLVIIEPDESLNLLLKTTAEMQGYEVSCTSDYDSALNLIKSVQPALVVLDAGESDTLRGLEVCSGLKNDENLKSVKIVLSTVVHDKKLVLNTGADLYLPKPYELLSAFCWIEQLMKEFNY